MEHPGQALTCVLSKIKSNVYVYPPFFFLSSNLNLKLLKASSHANTHVNRHVPMVGGEALPALLCTLSRFTLAAYILRSGAKWTGAETAFMYTGSLSVSFRRFTADLSKLLIHHHFLPKGTSSEPGVTQARMVCSLNRELLFHSYLIS